jgi:hypothetical protein
MSEELRSQPNVIADMPLSGTGTASGKSRRIEEENDYLPLRNETLTSMLRSVQQNQTQERQLSGPSNSLELSADAVVDNTV